MKSAEIFPTLDKNYFYLQIFKQRGTNFSQKNRQQLSNDLQNLKIFKGLKITALLIKKKKCILMFILPDKCQLRIQLLSLINCIANSCVQLPKKARRGIALSRLTEVAGVPIMYILLELKHNQQEIIS